MSSAFLGLQFSTLQLSTLILTVQQTIQIGILVIRTSENKTNPNPNKQENIIETDDTQPCSSPSETLMHDCFGHS